MQTFYMTLMVLFVTGYTCLFGYSLYKANNKKGMVAVICLIIMVIASPFLLYKF
ncbi:hypothetical protein [Terribacillus aidingensis]|uniref:hypothetical protein n=1 Tax=Terribacillus aidingensis TaxID=586416 RepID=UPI00344BB73A